METDALWSLVADVRRRGLCGEPRDAWLLSALARLPPPEIVRFQACVEYVAGEALTWNLWAAADLIFGGWCSDDMFCYFQQWLIGFGRPFFEAALADPDVLADAPEVLRLSGRPRTAWPEHDRPQWKSLIFLAPQAYEEATGAFDDCGDSFYAAAQSLLDAAADRRIGFGPRGQRWSARDAAEATRRLPRLASLFPLG